MLNAPRHANPGRSAAVQVDGRVAATRGTLAGHTVIRAEQRQEHVWELLPEYAPARRTPALLAGIFSSLALLLTAIGTYGVLSYAVSQRRREIGLRMALGAAPGRVRGMVLRQVGVMTAIGGVLGLAAATGLGRLAQSLLFELKGWDPIVLSASAVTLTLVALGAGFIPALRASQVEPMRALRYE